MNLLAARHNWKQTEQIEQDARRLLLQNVAYAYNNVMLAKARRNIAIEDMRYNRELLKETELKYGVGASTLSDVLNFKVNYNNAESNLYSANYSLAASKYALAALMGLTEGTIPDDIEFPEELADGDMGLLAFAIREKYGLDHPHLDRFEALENELMDEHFAVCAEARKLLRAHRRAEAAELLTKNFRKQFVKVRAFLQNELATAK